MLDEIKIERALNHLLYLLDDPAGIDPGIYTDFGPGRNSICDC